MFKFRNQSAKQLTLSRSCVPVFIAILFATPVSASSRTSQQGVVTIHDNGSRLSLVGDGHVVQVIESEPTLRWTLQKGDVLLHVGEVAPRVPEDLFAALRAIPSDGHLRVEVERNGGRMTIDLQKREFGRSLPPEPPTPPALPR